MRKYVVIFEAPAAPGESWGAYTPDIPGCVGIGDSFEACRESIEISLSMHIEDMRERGVPLPEPTTRTEELMVAA